MTVQTFSFSFLPAIPRPHGCACRGLSCRQAAALFKRLAPQLRGAKIQPPLEKALARAVCDRDVTRQLLRDARQRGGGGGGEGEDEAK